MRYLILIASLFIASVAFAQTPVISPLNPVVALAGTRQFSCASGNCSGATYACANASNGGTCFGSVTAGGLYTAPSTGTASQSLGGYQLLPNDHIFNTRVDGLALRSDSATLMTHVGSTAMSILPEYPVNYVNGSTPTDVISFEFTSTNNGTYQVPQWPSVGIENGWFDALVRNYNNDHHINTIDTTNGNLGEIYNYFAQAVLTSCTVNASNSATCAMTPSKTSSGFSNPNGVGLSIQIGGFTGGDTYLNTTSTITSATATSITFPLTHAAASTSTTGVVSRDANGGACATGTCNSQSGLKYTYADYVLPANGSSEAAGVEIEPLVLRSQEFVNAVNNSVPINHALAMTLQNGFICGSSTANACAGNASTTRHIWPATAEAFSGGGVIPYGLRFRLKSAYNCSAMSAAAQVICTTLKNYGTLMVDGGIGWQIEADADNMPPIEAAAIKEINSAAIAPSNFEVPDESTLMEVSTSGAANNGEIVTLTSAGGTATTNVDLQNTAVNVATNQMYIMAGTPQLALTTYSNGAVTCAMSPTVGSITSGCLYTAPASVTVGTTSQTTVTVTSSVTATVKAEILITVLPASNFNLLPSSGSNFTDSHGVVWFGNWLIGASNLVNIQGCCNNSNNASFSGTDKQLWWSEANNGGFAGNYDYKMDFYVPNGVYQVTYNNGSMYAVGANVKYFYGNGALIGQVDENVSAGGQFKDYTLTANVTVTNNILSFYNTGIGFGTQNKGDASSVSILLTSTPAGAVPAAPSKVGVLLMASGRKQ